MISLDLFPALNPATSTDLKQSRLLKLAAAFLFCYALIITLSPAARSHTWAVTYRWQHWLGFAAWMVGFSWLHRQVQNRLTEYDPYLLPIGALLTGWGTMEIWRLSDNFGLRQTIWLLICIGVVGIGLRLGSVFQILRRYKYLWLIGGLLLTGLTFFFGTYPGGVGPHLWLGCCGIYLQPSEPLKLLLIVYLTAYLADHLAPEFNLLQLVTPTLLLTGVALSLLIGQRDLGTAILFIVLYATILYLASGRRRILLTSLGIVVIASIAGYLLFDVVRLRVDAWLNPWIDPSGRAYQIVQSLLAVAAGGILGSGPGMGSPGLVPVAHSDFIFASISEEMGLAGSLAMIALYSLFTVRGMLTALRAPEIYQRYLAAGITTYITAQSILIIGGNLRLFPLTGVTLPFVSYGGSSLLTAFIALLLLLQISNPQEREPSPLPNPRPYLLIGGGLLAGLVVLGLLSSWWSIWRSSDLLTRSDNPRRSIADRYVPRGSLLDRNSQPLDVTTGESGSFERLSNYPELSSTLGYTHPIYGQAGLEASLDPYLRGERGNPASWIWWNELLTQQPPPGLNVRLSLDLNFQRKADELLGSHSGAVVLLNASSGEILAMASHPTFDANTLEENWDKWIDDPNAPFINRATQGLYSPGGVLGPFLLSALSERGALPFFSPNWITYDATCVSSAEETKTWAGSVQIGCQKAIASLGSYLGSDLLLDLYKNLGFYTAPDVSLPTNFQSAPAQISDVKSAAVGKSDVSVTPLQMALAAASLTADGARPPARLALAVNTPLQGWVILPASQNPVQIYTAETVHQVTASLAVENQPLWQTIGSAQTGEGKPLTWMIGGTLTEWTGTPLAIAVLLEEDNSTLAQDIGQGVLKSVLQP